MYLYVVFTKKEHNIIEFIRFLMYLHVVFIPRQTIYHTCTVYFVLLYENMFYIHLYVFFIPTYITCHVFIRCFHCKIFISKRKVVNVIN